MPSSRDDEQQLGRGSPLCGSVPRHFREQYSHGTEIRNPGEGQPQADKAGKICPSESTSNASSDPVATSRPAIRRTCRSKAQRVFTLATRGKPACTQAVVPPCSTIAGLPSLLQQIAGNRRAHAGLADQNDRPTAIQIGDPRFDLVQRNIKRARQVAAGKLGSGADIDQLRLSRRCYCYSVRAR